MNKYLSACLLACLCTSTVFAQNQFDNGGWIKIGYHLHQDDFGNMNEFNNGVQQKYAESQGDFDDTPALVVFDAPGFGMSLEFGHYWFLGIPLPDFMKIGLDATFMELNYSAANHQLFNQSLLLRSSEEMTSRHAYLGPKVGPMLSLSPADNMAFDLGFKVQALGSAFFGSYDYSVDVGGNSVEFQDVIAGYGFGIRLNPSVLFRYRLLMVGVEWNLGDINHNVTSGAAGGEGFDNNTPMSSTELVVGLKF